MNKFNKLLNLRYKDVEVEDDDFEDYIEQRMVFFLKDGLVEKLEKDEIEGLISLLQNNLKYYDKYISETDMHNYGEIEARLTKNSNTIYLIKCNRTELYKIGFTSRNVKSRFAELKTSNPTIELIDYYGCYNNKIEKLIHQYFEDKNKGGEWFELNETDIDKILYFVSYHNQIYLENIANEHCFHDFHKYEKKIFDKFYKDTKEYFSKNKTENQNF